MSRPGRWISLVPIVALVPRLGLVVLATDRQQVSAETRVALLWLSSAALAVLVGLAEVYIGAAVVSRKHGGLAALWVGLTVLLNALIVPLSVSGLEAVPVWKILGSPGLQVAWGAGLGVLSTLCVCGCLWADVVFEGSGLAEGYEAHLLGRLAEEEARREALEAELSAARAETSRIETARASRAETARADRAETKRPARVGAGRAAARRGARAQRPHTPCALCGFWDPDQRVVAGHIRHCRGGAGGEGLPA